MTIGANMRRKQAAETETGKRITALLLGIVQELVDMPQGAAVQTVYGSGGRTIVLTVTTGRGDIGKVIGKRGKTAEALRYLLEAMAARHKIKLILEIDDERQKHGEAAAG